MGTVIVYKRLKKNEEVTTNRKENFNNKTK